ncbi:MAG: hypothetical protein ACR2RV_24325 [Verrucomicrobiales bacterium]
MPEDYEADCSSNVYDRFTLEDLVAQVEQNARGEHRLTVPELHYVISDEVLRRVVDGQGVETVGQFAPDPAGDARRLELYRIVPADPDPGELRIAITAKFRSDPPAFDPGAWYLVSGKIRYPDEGGGITAILEAEDWPETQEPRQDDED